MRGLSEDTVREVRGAFGIHPVFKTVDTCAAEFAARTPYHYSTYDQENEVRPREREAEPCGVPELAGARGPLDLRLLGERVADARPEVLGGGLRDDLGVDEDMRGAGRVGVALERPVVVVDHGDGRGRGAVGADGRHGEHGLAELARRGLDGVDGLSAADGEGDVGLGEGGVRDQPVHVRAG